MKWNSVKDELPALEAGELPSRNLLITDGEWIYVGYLTAYGRWYEVTSGCACCGEDLIPTHWAELPKLPVPEDSIHDNDQ